MRGEYRSPHEDDGLTDFYQNGKLVRDEYRSPHKHDGLTQFYEDGELVGGEFRSPHKYDGCRTVGRRRSSSSRRQ